MGQYYMPTLIAKDGTISTLYPLEYDNGLKLMEHSYIGNNFVNAVCTQIWKNPMKVAWIGDYSSIPWEGTYTKHISRDDFEKICHEVWGNEKGPLCIHPKPHGYLTMKKRRGYLINHTTKEYVDLESYIEKNKWHEKSEYRRRRDGRVVNEPYEYDKCIHPLPLLTACGNGRGGGDYYDRFSNYENVGSWAFCEIELTGIKPKGYDLAEYHFSEQRKVE
jgi:hypothetical protein